MSILLPLEHAANMLEPMRRLAELDREVIEKIYEYTYKYGWLVAEERENAGWLPDRAYMEKARIEQELTPWIDEGLDEMYHTYEEWLNEHLPDSWVEVMMGPGGTIEDAFDVFAYHWSQAESAQLSVPEMEQAFLVSAWEALGGKDFFLQDVDKEFLGPSFIEEYIYNISDLETREQLEAAWEEAQENYSPEEIAADFIYNNDLETEFYKWLEDGYYGSVDWFADSVYNVKSLDDMYPQLADDPDFFALLYGVYLSNFPGLENEIDGIQQAFEQIESVEGGDIQDKILAFQIGLTTAHHHGTMADHLLGVEAGEGKKILDEISSGPHVEQWNADLANVLRKYDMPKTEEPEYYDPEAIVSKLITSALAKVGRAYLLI